VETQHLLKTSLKSALNRPVWTKTQLVCMWPTAESCCALYVCLFIPYYCEWDEATLTLLSPVVSNGYISKCSGPYWSNPPFIIFSSLGYSGAQDWAPECPNIKKLKRVGYTSMALW